MLSDMNRLITLLSAILLAVCARAQIDVFTALDLEKGEPCDTARYLVYYNMKCVTDTSSSHRTFVDDIMRLELGDRVHCFYSYKGYQADSANAVIMANGGSSFTGGGNVLWRLYKNYPSAGKTSFLEKFGTDRFVCVEDYASPAWTPMPDSSAVILGYPCALAVATYKGRTWYAWYTEDIPLDAGPWKLGGLPGLILRAYDARRHYVFDASGMEEAVPRTLIYYKGVKYEPVSRKTLNDIYRRYYADPVGYITNNPKVKVTIRDKQGNELPGPKDEPYNPIELAE